MTGATTIFALSSGAPPAAVGVIRVSGPRAAAALVALHGRLTEPRRATLGRLRDPETGEQLDHALLLWFPGPRTATGEDLAEFHVHGGRAVTQAVLAALARLDGLRAAEGGEFTRTAFANGVIDLSQAEGLADLIAAETEIQRRSAQQLAGGALSRQVAAWQARILDLAARIEAMLDFADEEVDADLAPIRAALAELVVAMRALSCGVPTERLRDGIRVVLAGPPNAGKSSLLNAIVGRDAAITASVAGTTRDVIEVPVALAGIPFLFIDTAGLRREGDRVEQIGVGRARDAIAGADILLWLGAPSEQPPHPRVIVVHPRCDEPGREDLPPGADIAVSATSRAGVEMLIDRVRPIATTLVPRGEEVTLDRRQRETVDLCTASLIAAVEEPDPILIAEALRHARASLDRLTGRAGTEEMLDALFGRFCIGK